MTRTNGSTSAIPPAPGEKPVLGHAAAFVDDPFEFVRRSVESAGDVFRMTFFGRDVYVVGSPDAARTALVNREQFTKPDDFEIAFGDALLAVDGDQWHRQRRAMERFFEPTRIREHTEAVARITTDRVAAWSDGQYVRLDAVMRSIALHNLFDVVFGRSLSADKIDALTEDANALNGWFEPTSWILPRWVPTPSRRAFHRSSDRLREWARTLLEDAATASPDESLLAALVALRDDPESAFDREEVLDQVAGVIFAGHETTALAMTYALHQIGSRPDVADRFYAEIDAALDSDGPLSVADLERLPYTSQIIDETLRCYPPVHGIPRITTASVELGGHTLSAGEQLLLSPWSIHHDPRFYDDPFDFDPGRWTDTSPRDRGFEFIPFGQGPRICIGRHFARLELQVALATIGRRYRLEATGDLEVTPKMTTQPRNPVTARVTLRD